MNVLSPEEVREIKFNTSHLTTRDAGLIYHVSRTTISNIRMGKSWAWVTEKEEPVTKYFSTRSSNKKKEGASK